MVTKNKRTHHFWIDTETLYETYTTIRGLRYAKIMDVPGMPDNDNCDEACIRYINKQYSKQ